MNQDFTYIMISFPSVYHDIHIVNSINNEKETPLIWLHNRGRKMRKIFLKLSNYEASPAFEKQMRQHVTFCAQTHKSDTMRETLQTKALPTKAQRSDGDNYPPSKDLRG